MGREILQQVAQIKEKILAHFQFLLGKGKTTTVLVN